MTCRRLPQVRAIIDCSPQKALAVRKEGKRWRKAAQVLIGPSTAVLPREGGTPSQGPGLLCCASRTDREAGSAEVWGSPPLRLAAHSTSQRSHAGHGKSQASPTLLPPNAQTKKHCRRGLGWTSMHPSKADCQGEMPEATSRKLPKQRVTFSRTSL